MPGRGSAGFVLIAALLGCGALEPAPPPPNVVVYLVDTLRADHLGLYGYRRNTSPRLEAFAKDAVVYETAYSPSSWTRPSTASLLTGRYPLVHGAIKRADAIAPHVPMLGERLRDVGYRTAAFSTNPNVLPVWGFDRGFDHFYDIESISWGARSEQVNEAVLQHLDEFPQQPFFLYVHTRDPHRPYRPAKPFDALWKQPGREPTIVDKYDGEIRSNDRSFGQLMEALKERGLYDETLVLFTSDHGEEMREHGEVGHGQSLFEEVVGIPLVIKFPGRAGAGTRVRGPVSLVDVAPTVLAAAGAEPLAETDGIDLGSRQPEALRPLFFDLNLLLLGKRHVLDAVRLGQHKLVERVEPAPERLLFDLVRDPGERRSFLDREAAVAEHLAGRLAAFRSAASSGLQLVLVGDPDEAELAAELVLATDGRFVEPRGSELEEDDRLALSDDARRLTLASTLRSRPNPVGEQPATLIDTDRIAVEVEPETASIVVEAFTHAGEPAAIYLGAALAPAGSVPITLRRDAPELVVRRIDTLLPITPEQSVVARPGLYLATVAPPGRQVEIDDEMERRLRELGYVE